MQILKYLFLPISLALLILGGCSETDHPDGSKHTGISVTDAWVAQKPDLTGVFGTLMNHTDKDVTVVGGHSEVATSVELHETVTDASGSMKMQPKPGGFPIPANSMYRLEPGKDHLMLMGLKRELKVGEQVTIVLELSDGNSLEFTAPVKPFSGANEHYAPNK